MSHSQIFFWKQIHQHQRLKNRYSDCLICLGYDCYPTSITWLDLAPKLKKSEIKDLFTTVKHILIHVYYKSSDRVIHSGWISSLVINTCRLLKLQFSLYYLGLILIILFYIFLKALLLFLKALLFSTSLKLLIILSRVLHTLSIQPPCHKHSRVSVT